MKYLIVRSPAPEQYESAIMFSDNVTHKAVARIHSVRNYRVVSAGFVEFANGQYRAYGNSESLGGMESRPVDSEIINRDYLMEGVLPNGNQPK